MRYLHKYKLEVLTFNYLPRSPFSRDASVLFSANYEVESELTYVEDTNEKCIDWWSTSKYTIDLDGYKTYCTQQI